MSTLTQADVDRTLKQLHQAGDAAARADGPLVALITRPAKGTPHARLMLSQARRLRDELDAAIAQAEARQAEIDARYMCSPWELEAEGACAVPGGGVFA